VPWAMAPVRSVYCGAGHEGRALLDEIAAKVQVGIAAGSYFLPTTAGTEAWTAPLCAVVDDGLFLSPRGAGAVLTEVSTFGESSIWRWVITQPMAAGDDTEWMASIRIDRTTPAGTPPASVPVDGSYVFDFDNDVSVSLCRPDCAAPAELRVLESCTFDGVDVRRHTVTFDGGDVVLDLPIGDSFAATEPAMFVRAEGTLDGADFVVEDYFDLVYNPEHHHFRRDFLVFFAAPIGDACGLMVTDLDPFAPEALQVVSLVDCAGAAVSTRAVSAAVVERVPG
jgi:hypothetical protein